MQLFTQLIHRFKQASIPMKIWWCCVGMVWWVLLSHIVMFSPILIGSICCLIAIVLYRTSRVVLVQVIPLILVGCGLSYLTIFLEYQAITYYQSQSKNSLSVKKLNDSQLKTTQVAIYAHQFAVPINVLQIDMSFDQNSLHLIGFASRDLQQVFVLQQVINNDLGFARLIIIAPKGVHIASETKIANVYFASNKSGPASVKILPSSKALAHDGAATNVFAAANSIWIPQVTKIGQAVAVPDSFDQNMVLFPPQPNTFDDQYIKRTENKKLSWLEIVAGYDAWVLGY